MSPRVDFISEAFHREAGAERSSLAQAFVANSVKGRITREAEQGAISGANGAVTERRLSCSRLELRHPSCFVSSIGSIGLADSGSPLCAAARHSSRCYRVDWRAPSPACIA
jgi:hypothetical protein